MTFLDQGFQKLEHYRQTDGRTNTQTDVTEVTHYHAACHCFSEPPQNLSLFLIISFLASV